MSLKHIKQRIEQGYCDKDVCNLDAYFLQVFIPALKQLKASQHGHPARMTEQQWTDILNKMISHFEAIDLYYDRLPMNKQGMATNEYHIQAGFRLFADYFTDLWI